MLKKLCNYIGHAALNKYYKLQGLREKELETLKGLYNINNTDYKIQSRDILLHRTWKILMA